MQSINIVKETKLSHSYRVDRILGDFDIKKDVVSEKFAVDIDIESEPWNIGLIVGASGTGKTTIAKELFEIDEYKYSVSSVIDDMPESKNLKEIENIFTSVGFSSPPSWLKPYSVLSTGEQMRVNLARALLEKKKIIVFDEYTSVVDRNVARIGSLAAQKYVRKNDLRFVAVTCHYDVIDWLMPDWILDTNKMEFFFAKKKEDTKSISKYTESMKTKKIYGDCLKDITIWITN